MRRQLFRLTPPPALSKKTAVGNALIGAGLVTFIGTVYYYTFIKMKDNEVQAIAKEIDELEALEQEINSLKKEKKLQ